MSEQEYPEDNYPQTVLLAKKQPFNFAKKIKQFLTVNAAFVSNNIYHLENSSLVYRLDIPPELDDKDLANITLNLIARSKSDLEETTKIILEKYPAFKEYSPRPDPLFFNP